MGRIHGGLRWFPLGLLVLTSLQHMTIQTFSGYLRALHTIDALLLFGISMHLMKRSWRWLSIGKKKYLQSKKPDCVNIEN
ncbi:hypothetical protein J2Y67_001661 [Neobacillus niacini]|nr:hypothetical protein [Neobacillus niacini]